MRRSLLGGVLLVSLLPTASWAERPLTLTTLMKQCGQKTIVMGKDEAGNYIQTGEKISAYCEGALEGMLSVLARTKAICIKEEEPTADFLLSVITTYRESASPKSDDAAEVVEAAFRQAFSCT